MKIVRYGEPGLERFGSVDSSSAIRDLSPLLSEGEGLFEFLARSPQVNESSLEPVARDCRLGPCVDHVGKLVCVGLNYVDHVAEANMQLPSEPVLFMKATSAICGPFDDVVRPREASKLDWEVELGVVIGKRGSGIAGADALEHVAGYCIVNDVSERSHQLEGSGQWTKGKSADTFAPIGPWLVTKDEIPDVQALSIWLEVNGVRMQESSTAHMHFDVEFLVSYISRFMSLHPGDIISTGTPPGVGMGMTPPSYLQPGDRLKLGIDGLGCQESVIIEA